jgi:hypothetical protein
MSFPPVAGNRIATSVRRRTGSTAAEMVDLSGFFLAWKKVSLPLFPRAICGSS